MVLDLIVIGILLISAGVAFMRGFVREVLTIGSLVGAALATYMFGPSLTPMTRGWIIDPGAKEPQQLFGLIPYEMLAPVIAFAIVFVVVIIALTIATHMISRGVHSVGLGPVDRSLGVAFGLVRGFLLIGLMALVLNFVFSEEQRTQYFGESKTYPMVSYTADLMHALLPGREAVDKVKGGDDVLATPGRQPLEPGQAGKGRSANGGYTATQRRQVEGLIEERQPRERKQFND